MSDIFKWMVNNYAGILSFLTFILGVILFFKKWVVNGIRAINIGNSFWGHFGEKPADKIKEIHDSIRKSHNTLEIRQSISEKYLQIGIFMCEPETGKCLWTNDCLNEIFGLDSAAMRDFGWLTSIAQEDRDDVHKAWTYAVKNKIPYDYEYTVINQRTKVGRKVTSHAVSVLNDLNEIVCYVGFIT